MKKLKATELPIASRDKSANIIGIQENKVVQLISQKHAYIVGRYVRITLGWKTGSFMLRHTVRHAYIKPLMSLIDISVKADGTIDLMTETIGTLRYSYVTGFNEQGFPYIQYDADGGSAGHFVELLTNLSSNITLSLYG